MKIDFDGRLWDFDVEDIPVGHCEAVEKYVPSRGMGDWYNQLDAGHTKAVIALWWVIRKRAGEVTGPISQPGDDFRPLKLLSAFNKALQAEVEARAAEEEAAAQAAEEEPDPTAPGDSAGPPRTRGGGGAGGRHSPPG